MGFDILCREDSIISPKSVARLPGNIVVEVPEGFVLAVALRSSSPKKKNLLKPHGIGIIDNDYCGDDDEILIQVYNFSDNPVVVKRGEKIAQGIFLKVDKANWIEVDRMDNETRDGFGSTDSSD